MNIYYRKNFDIDKFNQKVFWTLATISIFWHMNPFRFSVLGFILIHIMDRFTISVRVWGARHVYHFCLSSFIFLMKSKSIWHKIRFSVQCCQPSSATRRSPILFKPNFKWIIRPEYLTLGWLMCDPCIKYISSSGSINNKSCHWYRCCAL